MNRFRHCQGARFQGPMPLARSGAHSISHFDAPLLGPSFSTNQLGTPETQSRGSGVRAPTMLRNTWLCYKRIQFLPIHWNSGLDRLYAALLEKQNSDRCANSILGFITQVMNPVRRPVLRRLGCRGFGLRPIPTGITLKRPARGCKVTRSACEALSSGGRAPSVVRRSAPRRRWRSETVSCFSTARQLCLRPPPVVEETLSG